MVWTAPTPIPYNKLEIYTLTNWTDGGSRTQTTNVFLNGGAAIPGNGDPSGTGWFTVSDTPGTLESLEINTSVIGIGSTPIPRLYAVRVDGKLLVDTSVDNPDAVKVTATDVSAKTITVDGGSWGTYNNSKVWSNNLNSTSVQDVSYPIQNVFNGDVTSEWDTAPSVSFSAPSEYMVLDFTEFPNATTVDIWYVATSGSGFSVEVNDTLISPFSTKKASQGYC